MKSAKDASYRIEPLGKHHDRQSFTCGVESLNSYLKTQAGQDMRRKANAVFVLVPLSSPRTVAAYFTLCAYGLAPGIVPESVLKHIHRYPLVSSTLIGRLAVSSGYQGKGLGSIALIEALRLAFDNASVVGSSVVVVDALDDRAVRFYEAHGFIKLPESMRLILPIRTLAELLGM